jgi:hypothetical protein
VIGKLLKGIPAKARATAGQLLGAAAVVVGVGLLAGGAWAVIAAGIAAIVFGIAAEVD